MTPHNLTYLAQLHQLINDHFNLAEIQDLCLRLNVDYESIAGEEKPSRIRALLLGLGRNGQLPGLITIAQQLRPHINWPPVPDDFQLPESLALEQSTPTSQYHVYGDIVYGDGVAGDKVIGDKHEHHHQTTFEQQEQLVNTQYNVAGNLIVANKVRLPLQRPPRAEHFIDRKQELTKLLEDLRPSRVVTLCGPGGIGKSALAAEAVWTLAPDNDPPDLFPDGIVFHSFDNQSQTALALESIARAFGEEVKPTPKAAARRALAGRQVLLIVESAEKADDLSRIFDVAAGCGVLVTSRKRGDAVAERQDMTPLPLAEAVKLLHAWGCEQTADSLAARQICELVGGLPLAIRLVGRYLDETGETATEYLSWLQETPLNALDQGQQRIDSVSVLLQESLFQVSETARQVIGVVGLLALAPFHRESVAVALGLAEGQVRQPLGELVSFGLLLRSGEGYEVSHPLIHTYAREQIRPEAEVVQRLSEYYTMLVKTESKKGLVGYHRLAREREHMMQVLAKCAEQGNWEAVRGFVTAVKGYLKIRGYWTEYATAIEIGIKAARGLGHRPDEAALLGNLADNNYALGEVKKAIDQFEQALTIAREIGDRQREARLLGGLGHAYRDQGEVKKAIKQFEQALTIARELSDRQGEGRYLDGLGSAYNALGGPVQRSIEYYEQALTIFREIGDRLYEGGMLRNLGLAYRSLGQIQRAIEYHDQGLTIAREIGDRQGEGNHLGGLGGAYSSLGQVQRAIEYREQALTIAREIGRRHNEGVLLGNLGFHYRSLRQVQRAIEYFEQAVAIFRKMGDRRHAGFFLHGLGSSYLDLGRVAQAIELFEQTLAVARKMGDRHNEANHLGGLGNVYRSLGQVQRAIEYYEQALTITRELGHRISESKWLDNLGTAYRDLGQMDKAFEYHRQALAIVQSIGNPQLESATLFNLGKAHRLTERYEVALANFDRAIELNPDSDWYHYERGLVYMAKNMSDQAQKNFSQAIGLARQKYQEGPQNWRNFLNLALYSLANEDVKEAEHLYQEVIEESPPLKFVREAVQDLDDFLNLFPYHSQAQTMYGLLRQWLID